MKSLIDVLEEVAHHKPRTILFDRKGVGYTVEGLVALSKQGKLKPKAALRKKEFYGGTTVTGQVSIVRHVPGSGPVPIFLEGGRPEPGVPKDGIVVGRKRR